MCLHTYILDVGKVTPVEMLCLRVYYVVIVGSAIVGGNLFTPLINRYMYLIITRIYKAFGVNNNLYFLSACRLQ